MRCAEHQIRVRCPALPCTLLKLSCSCEVANRIPEKEVSFLEDQRKDRKMLIGAIDVSHAKTETERVNHKRRWDVRKLNDQVL